ncbi:GvpL/GvpF family gas vesicle protein [Kamptonema formosum]|uniref:GvpL/GvpF family gas vesicle protein n=1 Tax=Kamptonema formosum TaxID=331992 RepID=UPI000346038A|nr:GvpL/GvpF family gas vesicle protein [Oscillatoria sp. PCC 10802]
MTNEEVTVYTYAFLKIPATPLELPAGIAGKVELVRRDSLAALVELGLCLDEINHDDRQLMLAVVSHDRVIREVFRQTAVLPLRFGTCFVSVGGVLAHLLARQEEYLQKLEVFAGKAEYMLKFIPLSPPVSEVPSEARGKQYFLAKKQRYQTQQDFQSQQAAQWQEVQRLIAQVYSHAAAGLAVDSTERIYLLGAREGEAKLKDLVQAWQQVCTHWELQLGEPVPPYHFVGDAAG